MGCKGGDLIGDCGVDMKTLTDEEHAYLISLICFLVYKYGHGQAKVTQKEMQTFLQRQPTLHKDEDDNSIRYFITLEKNAPDTVFSVN